MLRIIMCFSAGIVFFVFVFVALCCAIIRARNPKETWNGITTQGRITLDLKVCRDELLKALREAEERRSSEEWRGSLQVPRAGEAQGGGRTRGALAKGVGTLEDQRRFSGLQRIRES